MSTTVLHRDCTNCGTSHKVTTQLFGRWVKCRTCSELWQVPAEQTAARAAAPRAATQNAGAPPAPSSPAGGAPSAVAPAAPARTAVAPKPVMPGATSTGARGPAPTSPSAASAPSRPSGPVRPSVGPAPARHANGPSPAHPPAGTAPSRPSDGPSPARDGLSALAGIAAATSGRNSVAAPSGRNSTSRPTVPGTGAKSPVAGTSGKAPVGASGRSPRVAPGGETDSGENEAGSPVTARRAAATKPSGSRMPLVVGGLAALVAIGAGAAFFVLRKPDAAGTGTLASGKSKDAGKSRIGIPDGGDEGEDATDGDGSQPPRGVPGEGTTESGGNTAGGTSARGPQGTDGNRTPTAENPGAEGAPVTNIDENRNPPPVRPQPAPKAEEKKGKKKDKPKDDPEAKLADEFFAKPRVVRIAITIEPRFMDLLRREPRKYVKATLSADGRTWRDVGIHLKGAAGSFRGVDDKPGLTINMDKFVDDQTFHGLDKFHLNNCVQDPSFVSELICGEIFMAAGVPASRGSHAIVSINGRDKGHYYIKEGYDDKFLERHFGNKKGNFYDGGFLRELDQPLQLISGDEKTEPQTELRALFAAARLPDPEKRFEEMSRLLDVPRFVSYLALEALLWDWDGYPMNRNNYRIYHDPKTDKIVFIPSGMDQMLGDINGPLIPNIQGFVARSFLETPKGKELYFARMAEIMDKVWKPDEWAKRLDEVEAVIRPHFGNHITGAINRFRDGFRQRQRIVGERLRRILNPTPAKIVAGGPGLSDDGLIRKWLYLGPVPVGGRNGQQAINHDFLNKEADLKPSEGSVTKTPGGDIRWKAVSADDGMIDFHAVSGRQADSSAGYLVTYLVCESDQTGIKVLMGSDDQGRVWINGKEVLKSEDDRGAAPDQNAVGGIKLNKGVNVVVFKVCNGFGGFQGILRFTKDDGRAFVDVRPTLKPDGSK